MISYHLECISHKLNMNKAASFPLGQFEKKLVGRYSIFTQGLQQLCSGPKVVLALSTP